MSKVNNGNRREALRVLVGLLVCGAGALGIVHFMVRREPSADETVVLGPLSDFPVGEFQKRTITITEHGTWLTGPAEKTVWLRRNSDNSCLVLSGTCPHRNCMVNLESTTFHCPCHHSRFDFEGRLLSPPALRSLDTLEYRVSNGIVSVQFQNFRKGIPAKELVPAS
jgi:Rieske Fe-S protein